ncbi:hypothetical protein DdX_12839 [Ditylenchus destructor]|uniref:Uncharacterized protein n=1 Tax=Ditylenchus destructor TaxID=166010 RepID=A0AAD4MVI0_9BILA|nr:hypothetical protein DdX_12839 [Ditylenchus destructor]
MCIHIKKSKASAVRRASANPAPAKKNGKASAATSAAVNPAPLKGDMGTTLSPMPEQPKPNNGTNNNCKHIEACAHHNVVDIPASLAAKQSAKTAKRDEEPNAITLTSEQPNSVSPPTNLLDSMIVLSTAISKLKNRKSSKFQCDVEVPAFILIKQYGFGFSTEEVCADESPVPAQRSTASRPPLRFDINFRNSAVPLLDESRLISMGQTLSTEMRKDRLKLLGRRKNNASALEYQPNAITLTSEQPKSVSPPTNLLDSMIVLSTAISKLKNRKSSKFQCDVEVPAFILIKQYGFGFSTEEVCADESPVPAQRITASRPPLRFDINFRNSAVPLLDESRLLSTSQTLSTEMRKDRLKLLGRRKNNASALEYQPDSNGSSPIESTTNLINLDCNNAARTKSRRRRSAECLVYFRWCEDELTESSA